MDLASGLGWGRFDMEQVEDQPVLANLLSSYFSFTGNFKARRYMRDLRVGNVHFTGAYARCEQGVHVWICRGSIFSTCMGG